MPQPRSMFVNCSPKCFRCFCGWRLLAPACRKAHLSYLIHLVNLTLWLLSQLTQLPHLAPQYPPPAGPLTQPPASLQPLHRPLLSTRALPRNSASHCLGQGGGGWVGRRKTQDPPRLLQTKPCIHTLLPTPPSPHTRVTKINDKHPTPPPTPKLQLRSSPP